MATYDAIVIGTGGIGSAAMFELARRKLRVLGLDRFAAGHERGSSHGKTRLIRQAYYEHPDYVPLVLRAYERWAKLEERCGETLFRQVGLLQVGPEDGDVLSGVRASAVAHNLAIEQLSAGDIQSRFSGFRVPERWIGLLETQAGYLHVEQCVAAHVAEAIKLGAEHRTDEPVQRWEPQNGGVVVQTSRGSYEAPRLIITAGAWANELLSDLGIRLEVRRKPIYWYKTQSDAYQADSGCPGFLFETAGGFFYGFPQIDKLGVKVGMHTGGSTVDDPLTVDRNIDSLDQKEVEAFLRAHMPDVSGECTGHTVCMYTMTADEHFVVDRHPQHPQVCFAAGLSGHGFKFAGVLGEALADLALEGKTSLPIGFLRHDRPGLR